MRVSGNKIRNLFFKSGQGKGEMVKSNEGSQILEPRNRILTSRNRNMIAQKPYTPLQK